MDEEFFDVDRPLLFSIAYRMLGSASDAEDVLQDAWLRCRTVDRAAIRSPKAFATTVVTRLCLDRLKSSRMTREDYVGPWLPEPVLTSATEGPDSILQRAESITLAFMVLLEKLSPEERAAFLLKDVFEYDHAEIADMLGTTAENSRQLLRRAKSRLAGGRSRLTGTAQSRRAVAERFARALSSGDGSALVALLTRDVEVWSDGGGKASAARRPLLGRDQAGNFLIGLHRTAHAATSPDISLCIADVNCEPALVVRIRGRLEAIFVLSIARDDVAAIRIVRNPDKLAHIDRHLSTLH